MFRKRLRQLDEVLRSAANVTVTEDLLEGASATLEIRDIAKVNLALLDAFMHNFLACYLKLRPSLIISKSR